MGDKENSENNDANSLVKELLSHINDYNICIAHSGVAMQGSLSFVVNPHCVALVVRYPFCPFLYVHISEWYITNY